MALFSGVWLQVYNEISPKLKEKWSFSLSPLTLLKKTSWVRAGLLSTWCPYLTSATPTQSPGAPSWQPEPCPASQQAETRHVILQETGSPLERISWTYSDLTLPQKS